MEEAIASIPKVIGEGTYGCVHEPSLKCGQLRIDYKNKVSKILLDKYAKQELDEYLGIQRADPDNQFFLGVPIQCKPEQSTTNYVAVKKCSKGNLALHEEFQYIYPNFDLLIMENGGLNLHDFAKKMEKEVVTPENHGKLVKTMEKFWIEVHRLFLGLLVFKRENIMHHDLKAQNIVYNPEANRIAFIDFGLMRPMDQAKRRVLRGEGVDNLIHWSYPIESIFYKKDFYKSTALRKHVFKKLHEGIDKVFDVGFLGNVLPDHNKDELNSLNRRGMIKLLYDDFIDLVNETITMRHEDFVNKSIETFDLYGVCMGLLYVWKKTYHIMRKSDSKIDYASLYQMLYFGILPNVNVRWTVEQALSMYEDLLKDILREDHIIFINHIPTKIDPPPHLLAVPKISDTKLEAIVEKEDTKLEAKVCPSGKIINPFTGRCVLECKSGQQRDDKFRCKTAKKLKRSCPETKDLNAKTGRCVAKCSPGKMHDENFHCKTMKKMDKTVDKTIDTIVDEPGYKKCPESKEINPKTGRCIKKCPPGKMRDVNFHCKTAKKMDKYNKIKNIEKSYNKYANPTSLSM
jgi:hypothetical protein